MINWFYRLFRSNTNTTINVTVNGKPCTPEEAVKIIEATSKAFCKFKIDMDNAFSNFNKQFAEAFKKEPK